MNQILSAFNSVKTCIDNQCQITACKQDTLIKIKEWKNCGYSDNYKFKTSLEFRIEAKPKRGSSQL